MTSDLPATSLGEMPCADGPNARQVAALVADAGTIGAACDALRSAGWDSRIAGNRITVGDRVFARFVADDTGGGARWLVYGIGEMPPVWIVGGDSQVRRTGRPAAGVQ